MSVARKIITKIYAITITISILLSYQCSAIFAQDNDTMPTTESVLQTKSYKDFIDEIRKTGVSDQNQKTLEFNATENFTFEGKDPLVKQENSILHVEQTEETGLITWKVNIANAGLYELRFMAKPLDGTILAAKRSVLINGQSQYDELSTLSFPRFFQDEGKPVVNVVNDEVKPQKKEIKDFMEYPFRDALGSYAENLLVSLKKGDNTITVAFISEPMAFTKILVVSPNPMLNYQDTKKIYIKNGYKAAKEEIKVEAESLENTKHVNDASLSISSSNDPKCSPASITSVKLNVFGDYSWRLSNQAVTWKFTAREDGLYKINFRTYQGYGYGLESGRKISIDGKVPFEELLCYRFPFNRSWYSRPLLSDNGEEFSFYLDEGEHTLTMEVVLGEIATINTQLQKSFEDLTDIYRKIGLITGFTPDPNYNYQLEKAIPDLGTLLTRVNKELEDALIGIKSISTTPPAVLNEIIVLQTLLNECKNNPYIIPKKLKDINRGVISISNIMQIISEQPLSIDFFEFLPPTTKINDYRSNGLDNFTAVMKNFIASFFKDYDALGSQGNEGNGSKQLKVWISRGKEWAEILANLIDSSFTTQKGINVRLDIIPQNAVGSSNPLLLSINSGSPPDVALSIPTVTTSTSLAGAATPVEYAIRKAAVDLSKFSDFEDIKKRFPKNVFVPLSYKNKIYGIPETINFRVMFYRKDIFKAYNFKLPKTWDEVTNDLLPKLNQNNMTMYIPITYDTLLPQYGGSYFTKDGMFCALNSAASYTAFNQLCSFYTDYRVPQFMNFYNRFKVGTAPVGIDQYLSYMSIYEAAPEIVGKWDIAPIPGVLQADGTINNSTGGITAEADIIINGTKLEQEAWEFLKWWTSKDIQVSFGTRVESRIGAYARWNTSNIEAFSSLPWNKSHIEVFKKNWDSAVEQPYVLGGYFTNRHLGNALNRVVISNQPVREALEESVDAIDKEMKRKQEYYGIYRNQLKGEK